MKRHIFLPLILLFFTGCNDRQATSSPDVPVCHVNRTTSPPVVDGVLQENCWRETAPEVFYNNIGGGPVTPGTTVRLLYDDTCLYVGFECQDPHAEGVRGTRDAPVNDKDHVAVYLDPDGKGLTSYCIEVSPEGTVADAVVLFKHDGTGSQVLRGWDMASLRSSATVYRSGVQSKDSDRFWTVELAIPFDELYSIASPHPGSGSKWRAGLYRVDYNEAVTYSALAPTGESVLIRPAAYAVLAFGE